MFTVEVQLPSGKSTRIRELTNKEYLCIIKYAQNSDYIGLNKYFEERYIEPNMHIIDRLYLLIYVRMIFIDSNITLTVDDKRIDIGLESVLDNIEKSYIDLETRFTVSGIEVGLDLPCITYYKSVDELLIATIKELKINDNNIKFQNLSINEQREILDGLPANIFSSINKFIQTIQDNLLVMPLINENKALGMESMDIEVLGNGVMHFITSIFSTDLEGYYSLIYTFQNSIMPGSRFFFDMSPIETQLILNAHKKKLKAEHDQLQKQNKG